jgi:sugar/nucleoside kinase (ribokinase family)
VTIGTGGERSFLTDRGVANRLSPRSLKASWLTRVDAVHVPLYSLMTAPLSETSLSAMARVRAAGGLVSVDLASSAPLVALGRRAAMSLVSGALPDVLFSNVAEASALTGPGRAAAGRLLGLAPMVVIKAGAAGCRVLAAGGVDFDVATKPLVATDTTGAGDAFDAGFLHALIAGGYVTDRIASPALLRRAAMAGHKSAARLLTSVRAELVL